MVKEVGRHPRLVQNSDSSPLNSIASRFTEYSKFEGC